MVLYVYNKERGEVINMELTNKRFGELVDLLLLGLDLDADVTIDKLWNKTEVTFSDDSEYIILNEDQQLEAVKDTIYETASYFKSEFLEEMTDIPSEAFEALEGHDDAVVKIIESTCGLDAFAEECIDVDGAGHFISHYDGEEIELDGEYSAFRIN